MIDGLRRRRQDDPALPSSGSEPESIPLGRLSPCKDAALAPARWETQLGSHGWKWKG